MGDAGLRHSCRLQSAGLVRGLNNDDQVRGEGVIVGEHLLPVHLVQTHLCTSQVMLSLGSTITNVVQSSKNPTLMNRHCNADRFWASTSE